MSGILARVGRSALRFIPTLIGVLVINFFLLNLVPGDAADVMAAQSGSATAETMAAWRHQMGLDKPLLARFWDYAWSLMHFDLGTSPRYGLPVSKLIMAALPNTLILMGLAIGIALVLGVVLGLLMAFFAGRKTDHILSVLSLVFYSVPGFLMGLLLIVVFAIRLDWLPSGGFATMGANFTGIDLILDRVRHLILPATALALFYVAIYARLTRASAIEVLSQDYIRTAAAKGLSPIAIARRHVLRNALLPITTMVGIHLSSLFGGSVVVETVFSWPGLGRLAFDSVMARDYKVLLDILFLSTLLVITLNLLVDMVQAWLDPRIRAA